MMLRNLFNIGALPFLFLFSSQTLSLAAPASAGESPGLKNPGERLEFYVGTNFAASSFSGSSLEQISTGRIANKESSSLSLAGFGARYFLANGIFAEGSGFFLPGTANAGTLTDSNGTRSVKISVFAPVSILLGVSFNPWGKMKFLVSAGREMTFVRMKIGDEALPSESADFQSWIIRSEINYPFFRYLGAGFRAEYRKNSSFSLLGERKTSPFTFGFILISSF